MAAEDEEFSDDDNPFQDLPPPVEPTRWKRRGKAKKMSKEERASREKELDGLKRELKHAEDMLMLRVPPEQLDGLLLSEIRPLYEDRKNKVAEWFREQVGENQEQEFLNGEGNLDNVIQMHIREIRLMNAKKQLKELKAELKDAEEMFQMRTHPMPMLSREQLNQNYQDKREKVADWYEKWTTPYPDGVFKAERWLKTEGNPKHIRPSYDHLLPLTWTERYDPNSRQPIFYNMITHESRSELPGLGTASDFVTLTTNHWMNHLGVPDGWGYDKSV